MTGNDGINGREQTVSQSERVAPIRYMDVTYSAKLSNLDREKQVVPLVREGV